MIIADELQEKKKQLEFQIKLAMQKFIDETGLLIDEIHAYKPMISTSNTDTAETIRSREIKATMDSLQVRIQL
jgi:hypothetical protein